MQNMTDFFSLCINMDTIITAICSNEEPQPILRQILLNFVSIINNPEWVRWSESIGAMPNLHWYWSNPRINFVRCKHKHKFVFVLVILSVSVPRIHFVCPHKLGV
jgi:hypothetical protein